MRLDVVIVFAGVFVLCAFATCEPSPSPSGGKSEGVALVAGGDSEIIRNSIGMQFKLLPAGSFLMGSPESEGGRGEDEGPQHKVTITEPFYMGVHEVTQEQYQAVMGKNRSGNFKGGKLPVENVSWNDAQEFCQKLSGREKNMTYRLPTEVEWEYACRAGSSTRFSFGDSDSDLGHYAWFSGNSGGKTQEVGTRRPNAWGLYDMHGNVWEWCADWYGPYSAGEETNPKGPDSGSFRVLRGGSWRLPPHSSRSADRRRRSPHLWNDQLGFRVLAVPAGGQ